MKKPLYEVTLEDAKEIIRAGYPAIIHNVKWKLEDRSQDLKEPCKLLKSRSKILMFWFMNDSIDCEYVDPDKDAPMFDSIYFDSKIQCYIEAHNRGYYVPAFDNLKPTK